MQINITAEQFFRVLKALQAGSDLRVVSRAGHMEAFEQGCKQLFEELRPKVEQTLTVPAVLE